MEKLHGADVEIHRCQPSDVNVRGAREFLLSGCDLLMTNVHTRMTIFYQLSNSTKESRREIVHLLKTGLEKLASQVPCLTSTITFDPVSKRGTMKTTGNHDAILLRIKGTDIVCTDLPSYSELEHGRFAPWTFPQNEIFPEDLINPVPVMQGQEGGLPACIFQVNFIDGGLILTTTIHHFVADGPSIDLILQALAAHCKGGNLPLYTNRTILSNPKRPNQLEHLELEQALVARGCKVDSTRPDPENPWSNWLGLRTKSAIIAFSRKAIASLKADVTSHHPSTPVSTSDCLHAICWTSLLRAKATLEY